MLQRVEEVYITILVDNITDRLLPSLSLVKRPPLISNKRFNKPPIAEHGFSVLVDISYTNKDRKFKHKFLFDTGVSKNGVIYNSDIFNIDLKDIETIVLSHGHFDHISGLISVLNKINRPIEIIAHSDAFLKRWIVFSDGRKARMDILNEENIKKFGGIIVKNNNINYLPRPKLKLANNSKDRNRFDKKNKRVLITGQIPRITNFEKGFPIQYKEGIDENHLIADPFVNDDQALVMLLKNKGLVILTGCGHAGIINTINYARKVTGIDKVYAIIGGFHLSGEEYEDSIPLTITELLKIESEYIIPCHCTGWKACNEIIRAMPQKYLQTSVGSVFCFN
ncbi:MAG TPA: MBL fold metallo-hydrolase [Nitrososphaeraceae archaeon]|nr:MBL fold metallo-hydrolase [Nitrososphaeraceae archaeon]